MSNLVVFPLSSCCHPLKSFFFIALRCLQYHYQNLGMQERLCKSLLSKTGLTVLNLVKPC